MDPLFPVLPEDLGSLTDEELAASLVEHRDIATRIHARDADTIGDRTAEAVVEQFQAGVVAIQALTAEQTARAEAEAATAAELDALAEQAGIVADTAEADADVDVSVTEGDGDAADDEEAGDGEEGDDGEGSSDDEEAAGEAAADAVVADAAPADTPPQAQVIRRRLPSVSRERQPQPVDQVGASLVASAGIEGVREGTALDRNGLARAIIEKQRRMGSMPEGMRTEVVVASVTYDYPDERRLTGDSETDAEKLFNVIGPEAMGVSRDDPSQQVMLASGGLCAPLTPIYDLPQIATTARPVRDALAGFQATRGGISYPTALTLADVDDAIGVVTVEQDEQGGTFATKTCQVLDCDPYNDAVIEAIFACVQWGNFGARTWPERIANFTELVGAAHARLAEGELLDALKAGSTQVTAAMAVYGYGAASNLLSEILTAAAGMRSRHRMDPNANLRVLLPAWTIDLLTSDLINGEYGRFDRSRDGVRALLGAYGVTPSWYLDSETGGGMIYGAQSAGALLTFPDTVKWFLFPEGTWVFLDGGTLDLGIVRDSILNSTNDYQVFWETFEGAAMLGVESLEITSTVCPNGTYGPPATALTC